MGQILSSIWYTHEITNRYARWQQLGPRSAPLRIWRFEPNVVSGSQWTIAGHIHEESELVLTLHTIDQQWTNGGKDIISQPVTMHTVSWDIEMTPIYAIKNSTITLDYRLYDQRLNKTSTEDQPLGGYFFRTDRENDILQLGVVDHEVDNMEIPLAHALEKYGYPASPTGEDKKVRDPNHTESMALWDNALNIKF